MTIDDLRSEQVELAHVRLEVLQYTTHRKAKLIQISGVPMRKNSPVKLREGRTVDELLVRYN